MKVPTPRGVGGSVRLGLTSALTAALALPAVAGIAPRSEGCAPSPRVADTHVQAVPANYHARFDAELQGAMAKSGAPIVRAEITSAEIAAESRLASRVPALQVSRDELTRLPLMVLSYAPGTFLTAAPAKAATTPEAEARTFFREQ